MYEYVVAAGKWQFRLYSKWFEIFTNTNTSIKFRLIASSYEGNILTSRESISVTVKSADNLYHSTGSCIFCKWKKSASLYIAWCVSQAIFYSETSTLAMLSPFPLLSLLSALSRCMAPFRVTSVYVYVCIHVIKQVWVQIASCLLVSILLFTQGN